MPYKLTDDKNIIIQYRTYPSDYCMPTMQMANDHYNIGILLSGDRGTVTPNEYYEYHQGFVAMLAPYIFHRTIPLSNKDCSSYLIKFSPDYVEPFIKNGGRAIFDALYDLKTHHFTDQMTPKIIHMFQEMEEEYKKDKPYTEQILQGMLFRLFDTIWDNRLDEKAKKFDSPLTEPIIHTVAIINQFYHEPITLPDTARKIGFSESHLSRLFKQEMGKTFSEYIIDVRISKAEQLLITTDKNIMQIAEDVGFCNGNYLSTCFKKRVGLSPLQFKMANKKN